MDLTRFMERSIRESAFVLLVCTPKFARKADAGVGGVGYEKAIVTGEIFAGEQQETKFVPLLRQGDAKVFKKYSQMKLQMKREALEKLNRHANEGGPGFGTGKVN